MNIRLLPPLWTSLFLLMALPQAQAQGVSGTLPPAYEQGGLMLSLSNIQMSYRNIRDPHTGAQLAGFQASGGLRAGYFLRDRWIAGAGMGGSPLNILPDQPSFALYTEAFTRYYLTPIPQLAFFAELGLTHNFWRGPLAPAFGGTSPRTWTAGARIGVAWNATSWLSIESSYGLAYLFAENAAYPDELTRLRPHAVAIGINIHLNRLGARRSQKPSPHRQSAAPPAGPPPP